MATITRENIGLLNDKLTVQLGKDDYFNNFEKNLKSYAKTASIQGFRKGMVPAGLIKKMYGQSIFTDEILKAVEKELNTYVQEQQLEIFAQPLPINSEDRMLDMNNPGDYVFAFEIGLKPAIHIDPSNMHVTRYVINITEDMINEEAARLQTRHGNMQEPETVDNEETVLNVNFQETDETGNLIEGGTKKDNSLLVKYFTPELQKELMGKKKDDTLTIQLSTAFDTKEREWVLGDLGLDKNNETDAARYFLLTITKLGFVEKAELNEEFFNKAYPGKNITTEEAFREAVKAEIENYFAQQSRNQVHDQIYHQLIDHTNIDFPVNFLKRWLMESGDNPRTADEAEKEYPVFVNQLKWSLITNQLINEYAIRVEQDEIKDKARNQMLSYMGVQSMDDAPWLDEYANRMMSDKKFVENTYYELQTTKLFTELESKVQATNESISAEDFASKLHHHHH